MCALFLAVTLFTLTPDASDEQKPTNRASKQNVTETKSSPCKGYYVGAFGGMGRSNTFDVSQNGAAFFPLSSGGPLPVVAKGSAEDDTYGFGGLHVGYEWLRSVPAKWYFTQAVEIEGYYASTTKKATLTNPTDRLALHQFKDTFPTNMGVILANWLFVLNNKSIVSPYVGIGVGTAILSVHGACAAQVAPPEPGINHFNSNPDDTDWVFATQGKAGLRFDFFKHMRLFAEYRFLYLTSSDYTFGSTKYPTHVASTKWQVHFDGICNNMFAVGLDFPW